MKELTLSQVADLIIEASYARVEALYPHCNKAAAGGLKTPLKEKEIYEVPAFEKFHQAYAAAKRDRCS
jgi:hypothetical protein